MANEENLKPIRSVSEAREKGKKGGKKSGQTRRAQKTYREMAKAMLKADIADKSVLSEMRKFGIEDTDLKAFTLLGLIRASGAGSYNAFDRLMELTGEKTNDANKDIMKKLDEVIGDIDAIANE